MILTIVGVEKKSGSFTNSASGQSFDYNNIYLYGLRSVSKDEENFSFGQIPEFVKIKNEREVIISIFGFEVSKDDLVSMIGNDYIVYYDKNGKPEQILPFQKGA